MNPLHFPQAISIRARSLGFSRFLPYLMLCLPPLAISARAQSTIDWFTLDAAGSAVASASYIINDTLGQDDAATLTSANYTIIGGFWALENLGPATDFPELHISPAPSANVLLSWPSPSPGYTLQENTNLANPGGWTDVIGPVSDDGLLKTITRPDAGTNRFYRLHKP